MSSSTTRQIINFCEHEKYKHYPSPYWCCISTNQTDFICHTIFIISMSDYFHSLLKQSNEFYEIFNDSEVKKIPRIRVKFDDLSVKSFIDFAYSLRIDNDDNDANNDQKKTFETTEIWKNLFEFASYINCMQMMDYIQEQQQQIEQQHQQQQQQIEMS